MLICSSPAFFRSAISRSLSSRNLRSFAFCLRFFQAAILNFTKIWRKRLTSASECVILDKLCESVSNAAVAELAYAHV